MPPIFKYKCSKCRFRLPDGCGTGLYVVNDRGERIICPHPAEDRFVKEALGERASSLEVVRERTGFISECVCLDCLHQFDADLGEVGYSPYEGPPEKHKRRLKREKDRRECPKCKSANVKTELEMVGQTCPKCKEGVIEEWWTGDIS